VLIIGINAYHGDASAAAVVDGRLVAAAEEERFTRIKHTAGFPTQALRYVVKSVGASPRHIDMLAVARDPWARIMRKAWHAVKMPTVARNRLSVQTRFASIGVEAARALGANESAIPVARVEHHRAHLASSFLVSPFDEAALFSIDGLGDFASAMWGIGRGTTISPMGVVTFPHSLGMFYTALTQYLGFPKYGDEYKVMGLASYGEPDVVEEFHKIVLAPNGRMDFMLAPEYFTYQKSGAEMTWGAGEPTIGRLYSNFLVERLGAARDTSEPVDRRHMAIAASMQARLEEVIIDRLRSLHRATGLKKLCLAGGVAFNCAVNGKILEQTGFEDIYIQSAAGDAGLAVGAAFDNWYSAGSKPREFVMEHANWGPEFRDDEIAALLSSRESEIVSQGCAITKIEDEDEICRVTTTAIAQGMVVGWFQGRMEWGPRALGNRSILADPRRVEMRDILNSKIKRREMFRPFAPSVLEEAAGDYFTQSYPSPFMLMAYAVRPERRAAIPATTHVDGTGRLQTVNPRQNLLYYKLIREFGHQTGVPMLLNTSFNENEPVVCRPEEALDCFLRTKMDLLVMGHFTVRRVDQDQLSSAPNYLAST
jgi:carbamoyltransferase